MVMGVKQWFDLKGQTRWLAPQPQIIDNIIQNSTVSRKYGIHMNVQIRNYAEMRLAEWLKEEYAPGCHNVEKIYSLPLLKELIAYHDKGNYDRVDSMLMLMIYKEELHNVVLKEKAEITTPENGLFAAWDSKLDRRNRYRNPEQEGGAPSGPIVYRSSFEKR